MRCAISRCLSTRPTKHFQVFLRTEGQARWQSTRSVVASMAESTSCLFEDAKSRSKAQLVQDAPDKKLVHIVMPSILDDFLQSLNHPNAVALAKLAKFKAKSGEVLLLPDEAGALSAVLLGLDSPEDMWGYAALPGKLPAGSYELQLQHEGADAAAADKALLGWNLGCYKFTRYKTGKLDKNGSSSSSSSSDQPAAAAAAAAAGDGKGAAALEEEKPLLVIPEVANQACVLAMAESFFWCRDMINTPAEDMGPQHLAAEAAALAAAHKGATLRVIEGDSLLSENYPAVHTVGRAAARPPLLIEINWTYTGSSSGGGGSSSSSEAAAAALPLVALVGKGVCFDSGGLDIKTATGMKLMKKDMGGAALMLGLAHVIMSAQLPVRLRLLVPAVENAISGNAYRPGDVLRTRAGITVENGNTDAEGRLILCDAIYEAANGSPGGPPDVLIDAATLTGAARVALGPELPVVFSSSDETWQELEAAAKQQADPLWRLPLWPGYRKQLDSKVADIGSTGEPGQAGAITAALFLQEFARSAPAWLHIDTAGWVSGGSTGPGKPEGGEALGLRALWQFLQAKYGKVAAE